MDTMSAYTFSTLDCVWIAGTVLSSLCLILQSVLFASKPQLRHVDQSIVMQLTVARLVLTFVELFRTTSTTYTHYKMYIKDALGGVHLYMLTVLAWMMFVYARNLRDQVLERSRNYSTVLKLVWFLSILAAVDYFIYFCFEIPHASEYLKIYVGLLVFFMTLNVLLNFEIIYKIIRKKSHINIFKKFVIIFILLCLTDASIIMKYFIDSETGMYYDYVFSVFNSFQVLAMTLIFIIPVRSSNAQFGLMLD